MAKEIKEFSFSDLDKSLTKVDPLGSIMSDNTFSKIDEWIGTGNYLLNAQISGSIFKGVPNSRSIMLSGVPGCLHPDTKVLVYISDEEIVRTIEEEPLENNSL